MNYYHHDTLLPVAGHHTPYPDHCYETQHQDSQVRAFSNEWPAHGQETPFPHLHALFRAFSDEWPAYNNETLLPVVGHQGYGTQYPDKWTLQLCVTCIMPLLTTDNELLPFNFLPHECGLIRIYLLFQVSIVVSFFTFSRQMQLQFTTERDWNQFHQLRNPVLAMVGEVEEVAELLKPMERWSKGGTPRLVSER